MSATLCQALLEVWRVSSLCRMVVFFSLRCIQLFATPWTIARQAPLSVRGISQARILEVVTISSPGGDLPDPGIEPKSPELAGRFLTAEAPGKPKSLFAWSLHFLSCFPRPHWEYPTKLANSTKGPNLCVLIIGTMNSHYTLPLKGSCVFKDITSHTQAVISQKWKRGTCWEENTNLVFIHFCIIELVEMSMY